MTQLKYWDIPLSQWRPLTSSSTATVAVGAVTSVGPTVAPAVSNVGTSTDAVLNFALQQGAVGNQGSAGAAGPTGPAGLNGLDTLPAGFIAEWPAAAAPANWALCDGGLSSRTTDASLYAVIGTTFGVGDGSTTFNRPDYRDRVPLGASATRALGVSGGSATHTHTLSDAGQAKLDATSGTIRIARIGTAPWSRSRTATASTADSSATEGAGVGLTGSTDADSSRQPYIGINFIIKKSNGDTPGDSQLTGRVSTLENGYRLVQTIQFASSGTFTKASYSWLRAVRVKLVGGGGAGGGAPAVSGGNHADGGGGGGGGYAEQLILAASIAASVTVTVGAGGVGGTSTGGTGGASSFNTHVVATGGTGGIVGTNNSLAIGAQGGTYGIGTAGDLLLTGSEGGVSSGYATLPRSGQGGSSVMGGGAGGVYTGSSGGKAAGAAGGQYGGGGSGAGNAQSASSATAGGSGANGIVIVELYA